MTKAKTKPKKRTPKPKLPPAPSPAEILCSGLSDDMKALTVTLAESALALQKKITDKIPEYEDADLFQWVTVNTGETIMRGNPMTQEFRATVRDYAAIVTALQTILSDNKKPTQVSDLDSIRKKFKVAK